MASDRGTSLPDWTRDELILALDLYFQTRGKTGGYHKTSTAVIQLSDQLHRLELFPAEVRAHGKFRNPAGVALKLGNFAAIDPTRTGAGMPHGARADKATWDEWAHRPDELSAVAAAIRATGATVTVDDETNEDEEYEAEEGRLLFRKHRRYERDRKLVARKRADVLKKTGRLACEVCDFDSSEEYGEGVVVIDVHHVLPLHKIGESKTRLTDLALVCPTCHRVIHAHKPFITPAELKARRSAAVEH